MEFRFQINLGGIIDLLSNHIYSSPQVFVRELLQNAVDAITARGLAEPGFRGEVHIELPARAADESPVLVFRDNGIGLTEEEIHRFLATIGQTSKRDELTERRAEFIGQFGIGLLSCFVVSDEIVVETRSATDDAARAVEWRGRADGTYTIKVLEREAGPGTEVRLRCKAGSEEYFAPGTVRKLARHYGSLLPYPITLADADGAAARINDERPPWREKFLSPQLEREAYLDYGRKTFGTEFFDYVPLSSAVGEVQGAAYVLTYSPSLAMRKTHRVYLKNMLLSENAEGLLPDWAFFVKCVVNAGDLRPTASRESFYEDEALSETRDALGQCLRRYLVGLADENPHRLKRLIQTHYLSIKALAVDDDDFFRLFVNWLPFETNMGTMTLAEYRKANEVVRYVPDLDGFRQLASVAAAQGLCVVNAAYVYDAQLLQKLYDLFPGVRLEAVDGQSLTHSFEYLTLDEQEEVAEFVRLADRTLRPFGCAAEVRKFAPAELPALYNAGGDADFRRSLELSKEVSDSLWSSVLDRFEAGLGGEPAAQLCFNHANPVVRKLGRMRDETLLRLSVQMLYVQALLLGHRPLNAKELKLLNEGLMGFIEWGADAVEGWIQ